jgi:hypothetical protein
MPLQDVLAIANLLVVGATGAVVAWYTVETRAMRKRMADTFRLSLLQAYFAAQALPATGGRIDIFNAMRSRSGVDVIRRVFPEVDELLAKPDNPTGESR